MCPDRKEIVFQCRNEEMREVEMTLHQIEKTARSSADSWGIFMDWIGGQSEYRKLFGKSAPRIHLNKTISQLESHDGPQSRRHDKQSSKQSARDQRAQRARHGGNDSDTHRSNNYNSGAESEESLSKIVKKEKEEVVSKPADGNLEDNTPLRVRSLHHIKWTAKH